jgi:hypothetical protein
MYLFEFIRMERGASFMKLSKGGASYKSSGTSGLKEAESDYG